MAAAACDMTSGHRSAAAPDAIEGRRLPDARADSFQSVIEGRAPAPLGALSTCSAAIATTPASRLAEDGKMVRSQVGVISGFDEGAGFPGIVFEEGLGSERDHGRLSPDSIR